MTTALSRYVGHRAATPAAREDEVERCEMCASVVAGGHDHLVDVESRALLCACRACALLFTNRGSGAGRYRPVPDRWRAVPGFALTASGWDDLQVPVAVAFFFRNSAQDRWVASYPSPAGATESVLPLDAWDGVLAANPELARAEPDTEAVLVRAVADRFECFVVPITACYELVGTVRLLWRGFDGGQPVHDAIDRFFTAIAARAVPT